DRPRAVGHHPGIGGEIEAHPAPLVADEADAQNDLPGLAELVGAKHLGHRIEVTGDRRPDPVSGGECHPPERITPAAQPSVTGHYTRMACAAAGPGTAWPGSRNSILGSCRRHSRPRWRSGGRTSPTPAWWVV